MDDRLTESEEEVDIVVAAIDSPEPAVIVLAEAPPTTPSKPMNSKQATGRQLGGAALAGGLVGLAVAGPAVAAAVGVGALVAASTSTSAGKWVRHAGGATVAVFGATLAAGQQVKRLNDEHQLVQKSAAPIRRAAVAVGGVVRDVHDIFGVSDALATGLVAHLANSGQAVADSGVLEASADVCAGAMATVAGALGP